MVSSGLIISPPESFGRLSQTILLMVTTAGHPSTSKIGNSKRRLISFVRLCYAVSARKQVNRFSFVHYVQWNSNIVSNRNNGYCTTKKRYSERLADRSCGHCAMVLETEENNLKQRHEQSNSWNERCRRRMNTVQCCGKNEFRECNY